MENYIKDKENLHLEYKESSNELSKSIYETYSAFSNTEGGVIYLGIKENKDKDNEIIGVNNPLKLITDFFNTLNNKKKVSFNNLNDQDFKIIEINKKKIIKINVPECPRDKKPIYLNDSISDTYKRNHEGDYKCSNLEILSMFEDCKVDTYDSSFNNKQITFEDIDLETLKNYRDILNQYSSDNIYRHLDDKNFIKKLGFGKEEDNKIILTNASVLLFTNQNIIKRIYSNYFIDYMEKTNKNSDYDYRITSDDLTTSGNLMTMYLNIVKRILKDVPNPFILGGLMNTTNKLMSYIIRESLANAVINCDYFLETGIKIIKYPNKIVFENVGRLKVGIIQALNGGKSLPRNIAIMTALRNIGLCDRAGTGIPRIFEFTKKLNFLDPVLEESGESNTTTLTINLISNKAKGENETKSFLYKIVSEHEEGITIAELIKISKYSKAHVSKNINQLIKQGILTSNTKSTRGKLIYIKK